MGKRVRINHPPEFKARVVREALKEEKSVSQLASEYGIHPNLVTRWRDQALAGLPSLFAHEEAAAQAAKEAAHERQLEALYAEIGKLRTQLSWLKKKSGERDVPR